MAISFDDLFVRHAVNRGLLLITCDTAKIQTSDKLTIDLEDATVKCHEKNLSLPCRVPGRTVQTWLKDGGVIEYLRLHGSF